MAGKKKPKVSWEYQLHDAEPVNGIPCVQTNILRREGPIASGIAAGRIVADVALDLAEVLRAGGMTIVDERTIPPTTQHAETHTEPSHAEPPGDTGEGSAGPENYSPITVVLPYPPRGLSPNKKGHFIAVKGNPITVVLPYPPRGLSPNKKGHFIVKNRLAQQYRLIAKMSARNVKPFRHVPWQRVVTQVTWYKKTKGKIDADNCLAQLKNAWDGIVDAGILVDDSHEHLSHLPIKFAIDKHNPRVEVQLWQQTDS